MPKVNEGAYKYINIVILTGFGFGQKFDIDQLMINL